LPEIRPLTFIHRRNSRLVLYSYRYSKQEEEAGSSDKYYFPELAKPSDLSWVEKLQKHFGVLATPCASPPPRPSIFSDYSFLVCHPVNWDDWHLLAWQFYQTR
jgi:hypothetical protein